MKLNNTTRFSKSLPSISQPRSGHDLSHSHALTCNAGKLVPFFFSEVLPGDTFDVGTSVLARMSTPIRPVMDTAFLDYWFWFVPQRLVWEHTKEFYGENNTSAWTPTVDRFIPQITITPKEDGNLDHFGLPTKISMKVQALPLRALRLIWNEWYRDQNTQDPLLVNMGDTETDLTLDDLLPLNKRKDYFTTALPAPQKGPDVLLPLAGTALVYAERGAAANHFNDLIHGGLSTHDLGPLTFYAQNGEFPNFGVFDAIFTNEGQGLSKLKAYDEASKDTPEGFHLNNLTPLNLRADLSSATSATINDLRKAFAVQAYYELNARSGSRYREFLAAHFGVSVPDLTVQVPEFLGGDSLMINMNQVIQTSASGTGVTPQGNEAAFSKTVGSAHSFTKSFTEPGYVIGCFGVRTAESYQNGIPRAWSRRTLFDFYDPLFDSIGDQPIYNRELFYQNSVSADDEVFGYQEAWAEYRYAQNYVSGAFRSNYSAGGLTDWTYVNNFDRLPVLSDGFIRASDVNLGRTLATTNMEGAPQFLVDFYFDFKAVRPMSEYSTPSFLGRQ